MLGHPLRIGGERLMRSGEVHVSA